MQNIINIQQLEVINEIIERIAQEYRDEDYPVPAITWTGNTREQRGGTWFEIKTVDDMGTYMIGWTNGRTEQGVINFIEA